MNGLSELVITVADQATTLGIVGDGMDYFSVRDALESMTVERTKRDLKIALLV